ncbi:MAG: hypothetical protein GXO80_03035 [Chlorobi bacterium]|nr:hypothetical protein [Chlorobiota bacterium]
MGYNWKKIMKNKSNEELKIIFNNKKYEPLQKINAVINELNKRNLLDSENKLNKELFKTNPRIKENIPNDTYDLKIRFKLEKYYYYLILQSI